MEKTLKTLSVLSLLGIVSICFFTFYSADDYCLKQTLAHYSVFDCAWGGYLRWDGRSISLATFLDLFMLQNFPPQIITFVWACSFIAISVFVVKIVQLENSFFKKNENSIVVISAVCISMWLGMWKLIPDIIYWSSGGQYSFGALLGIFWLVVFIKQIKAQKFNIGNAIFIFFLSIVCAINAHNFIIALIFLALIELLNERFVKNNNASTVYILCALAGLLFAFSVVFFAPGNIIRLNEVTPLRISFQSVYFYFLALARYVYWLLALIIFLVCLITISGYDIYKSNQSALKTKSSGQLLTERKPFLQFIYSHKYLLAALSTVVVFSLSASFAVPRTSIFFAIFITIYVLQKGWRGDWENDSIINLTNKLILFGVFFLVLSVQLFQAYSLNVELNKRKEVFTQGKGKDVVVAEINKETVPFTLTFTDISTDTSYWANRCVARYYDLKTVRTDSMVRHCERSEAISTKALYK